MPKLKTVSALALLWIWLVAAAYAQTQPTDSAQMHINSRAAVLVEVDTGTTLFSQAPDQVIEPASFTKILTLYLVFEGLRNNTIHLADPVWVSETAWRTGGSKMFVGVNSQVPLEELIKGIAVVSGNDACIAAAEHLYGSTEAFVAAMNKKARELGMNGSRFLNPHGLPAAGQVTSAGDMTRLATAYLNRFPEAVRFHSMQEYTYNNITQRNRNRLLAKDSSVDGLKTGYVENAGYHLAATAKRDNMRLLAVVMGASKPSIREAECTKLLNWGFRNFALVEPVPESKPVATVAVWKGKADYCDLRPEVPIRILVPAAQKDQAHIEVDAPRDAVAPIAAGQPLGSVKVFVGNELKNTVPLVAATAIEQAGLLKRIWHTVARIHTIDWKWLGIIVGGVLAVLLLVVGVVRIVPKLKKRRRI